MSDATPSQATSKRKPPSVQRDQAAEIKALRAVELRLAGATFQRIADVLGYQDRSGAKRAYERALDVLKDDLAPTVAQHRTEQLLRLETLLTSVWGKAQQPSDPDHLKAIETARKLLERQARLLGLDAPLRVAVSDEVDAQIETLLAEMQANERAGN